MLTGIPPLKSKEDVVEYARGVMGMLEKFTRPKVPPRPHVLPKNLELAALMLQKRQGTQLTRDAKDTLELMGRWRLLVQQAENESIARLMVILSLIARLDEHNVPADKLRRFVHAQWGRMPKRPVRLLKVEEMAVKLSIDMRVLPKELRG